MPTAADLVAAIRARDAARVEAILADQPGLARERPAGSPSPLLMAAYLGSAPVVELLKARVAMDACEAAAWGDVARLARLIDEDPAAVGARSGDGWTPLHLAAFFGRREAAELLLARGASVTAISGGPEKNTPLHAALAGAADEAIVRSLVARGADVNAAGSLAYRPLHVAASRGNEALVRFLLAEGAERDARMEDGKTAADLAAQRGHPEVAALLGARAQSR